MGGFRSLAPTVVAITVVSACGLGGPQPAPSPAARSFSYEIPTPTGPVTAGAPLHFVWAPRADPNFQTGVAEMSLCYGLFGPWTDAAAAKAFIDAQRDAATAICPVAGAVVISDVVHTTSAAGERFATDSSGPREPGFYDLQQVIVAKTDHGGSTTVLHRILNVRAR